MAPSSASPAPEAPAEPPLCARLAALVPAPIATIDEKGTMRWLNEPAAGSPFSPQATRGDTYQEVFPDAARGITRAIGAAKRTGDVQVVELAAGNQAFELRIGDGPEGAIVLLQEVTEQRAAREAERRVEQVRSLLQGAPVGIFQTDAVGACLYANQRWCAMTGLSADTARGQGWATAVPPKQRSAVMQAWERAADEGREFSVELSFERGDATPSVSLLSATPIFDDEGEIDGYLGVLTDLSALRRAQEQAAEKDRLVQRITDASPSVMYIYDLRERRNIYANRSLEHITGFAADEIRDAGERHLNENIHPDDLASVHAHQAHLLQAGDDEVCELEYRLRHKRGHWLWMRSRDVVFRRDDHGAVVQILGTGEDITARREAKEKIGEAHAQMTRWAETLEAKNHAVETLREMGELLQSCHEHDEAYAVIRAAMQRVFPDHTGAVYLLETTDEVLEPAVVFGNRERVEATFRPRACWAIRRGKPHRSNELGRRLRCAHMDGDDAHYICAPLMANGEMLGVTHVRFDEGARADTTEELVLSAADAIELGLANLELRSTLRNQATREPLTGLYNRRFMMDALERELYRSRRHQTPLSVMMIDVDHFKRFNDSHGHDAGDFALQAVAAILSEGVRREDFACRYGGEEFAIILPDCPLLHAHERAEELAQTIRTKPLVMHGLEIGPLTISVGVSCSMGHGTECARLLKAADEALYAAKRGGRNRVVSAAGVEPTPSHARLAS